MKKLLVPIFAVVLIAGFFLLSSDSSTIEEVIQINSPATSTLITLEEKIGQLFMIGHWSDTALSSTTKLVQDHHLGGVIIMSAPERAEEIRSWTQTWESGATEPLFIAIDQEGGPVTRLKSSGYIQTGQREITSEPQAYEVGKIRGAELSELGINMNFAPVLDSAKKPGSFMYQRVFSDRERSADLASSMIAGMNENSVWGVVKHFPGHDDTSDDSHLTLPVVNISNDELDAFVQPFSELIESDPPTALMTAHVLFPEIDDVPASLSSFFLEDHLRDELGFSGIIITDDMSMDAIDTTWTTSEASVLALQAGADIVLLAAEPEQVVGAVAAVVKAVENGELEEERINESYERVLALKDTLSTNPN
jgi:beta-N-acetylhexosaminidase